MGEVTPFPTERKQIIFACSCGCLSYRVYSDGALECCNCQMIHTCHVDDPGLWVKQVLPEAPEIVTETDAGKTSVRNLGDGELASRSVLKAITGWQAQGELAFLCAYAKSGEGKHWLNVATEDQKEWVVGCLESLLETTRKTTP